MSTVLTVFANGGVPVVQDGSNVKVTRAWARATIEGQTFDLDPAMKEYREIAAEVNVATASGCGRWRRPFHLVRQSDHLHPQQYAGCFRRRSDRESGGGWGRDDLISYLPSVRSFRD